jgi:hypothetical protein
MLRGVGRLGLGEWMLMGAPLLSTRKIGIVEIWLICEERRFDFGKERKGVLMGSGRKWEYSGIE